MALDACTKKRHELVTSRGEEYCFTCTKHEKHMLRTQLLDCANLLSLLMREHRSEREDDIASCLESSIIALRATGELLTAQDD